MLDHATTDLRNDFLLRSNFVQMERRRKFIDQIKKLISHEHTTEFDTCTTDKTEKSCSKRESYIIIANLMLFEGIARRVPASKAIRQSSNPEFTENRRSPSEQ